MVKKIGIIVFVIAVVAVGYISLKKLNYLERSFAIFKLDSSSQVFEGRGGRGFGEQNGGGHAGMRSGLREGGERSGRINVPDSVRRNFQNYDQRNIGREANRRDTVFIGRGEFNGRPGGHEGFEGRGDRRGSTINLKMVGYYLAVFALFTLIVVYIEKGYRLIFKSKTLTQENSDLII
jgi:hypothetical protein